MTEFQSIENKMNELAGKVIPNDHLESFIDLPLKDKVFGIKFFATLSNDIEVIKMCEYAEKAI